MADFDRDCIIFLLILYFFPLLSISHLTARCFSQVIFSLLDYFQNVSHCLVKNLLYDEQFWFQSMYNSDFDMIPKTIDSISTFKCQRHIFKDDKILYFLLLVLIS